MSINKILRNKVNDFEDFISFIKNSKDLVYEVNEVDNETEIEVSILDDNTCLEIVGTYYFDNVGNFIREV